MRWVKKTGRKLFRLSFSTDRSSRKSQVFRLDPPVGKTQSKKIESKKVDCIRKLDLGFSRKRPFSTDKSDCIRNGLRAHDGEKQRHIHFCASVKYIPGIYCLTFA